MNILEPHISENIPTVEAHAQKPKEHEYRMLGSVHLPRGLRYWSMDSDGKVEEVIIDRAAMISMTGDEVLKSRANVDPRKLYCVALNAKNARRKMLRVSDQKGERSEVPATKEQNGTPDERGAGNPADAQTNK